MTKIFTQKYRVYYEDTDAGGVVYYANYLKFFERARTDFLRSFNIVQQKLLDEEKTAFVVRRCELDFIRPAKLDDLIEVSVEVKKVGASYVLMYQEIKINDEILSRLAVEIVCVDAVLFKPKKIDLKLREIFLGC